MKAPARPSTSAIAGTAMMSPVTPASAAPTGRATMTTAGWMRTLCG